MPRSLSRAPFWVRKSLTTSVSERTLLLRANCVDDYGTQRANHKLPVRIHEVKVVDGDIMIIESEDEPNLPPGLTADGHI